MVYEKMGGDRTGPNIEMTMCVTIHTLLALITPALIGVNIGLLVLLGPA